MFSLMDHIIVSDVGDVDATGISKSVLCDTQLGTPIICKLWPVRFCVKLRI